MTTTETGDDKPLRPAQPVKHRCCTCCCCIAVTFPILLILTVIALILAFTVFKPKDPTTTLVSATVTGVSPRVTIPVVQFALNVSLDLVILVHNPNRATFKHGPGKSFVLYRGSQVGEVDLAPGRIPARGSENIPCKLTIEADKFVSDVGRFLSDVMSGEVGIDTTSRIPGKVTILGIFKRHAVAVVECHLAIGFPDLKIRRQECKHHTKM